MNQQNTRNGPKLQYGNIRALPGTSRQNCDPHVEGSCLAMFLATGMNVFESPLPMGACSGFVCALRNRKSVTCAAMYRHVIQRGSSKSRANDTVWRGRLTPRPSFCSIPAQEMHIVAFQCGPPEEILPRLARYPAVQGVVLIAGILHGNARGTLQ